MAVSAHDNVCKSHDASWAIWFDGAIRIEHAITDNLPDGAPAAARLRKRRDFLGARSATSRWPHTMAAHPPSAKHGSSDRRRG